MCKEEDVRKSINSIAIIKFQELEETVDGNLVQCRCKNTNEVLNNVFTKDCDLPGHEDAKCFCVVVSGSISGLN